MLTGNKPAHELSRTLSVCWQGGDAPEAVHQHPPSPAPLSPVRWSPPYSASSFYPAQIRQEKTLNERERERNPPSGYFTSDEITDNAKSPKPFPVSSSGIQCNTLVHNHFATFFYVEQMMIHREWIRVFLTYSVQGREDDATNNGTPILDLRTPIRQRLKTAARILPFATLLTYSITTTSSTVPRLLLSSSPTYPPHPNSGLQRRHCQKLLTLSERNKFRVWCSRAQDDEACESWEHIENHLEQHIGNTTTRAHLFQKARGVDD